MPAASAVMQGSSSTLAEGSSSRSVVTTVGCSGIARGEDYRSMATIKTDIKIPARAPRKQSTAVVAGTSKVTAPHNGIDAVPYDYRVHLEDGIVVVRSNTCEMENATKSPCNACLVLSLTNIKKNALSARVTQAKVVCWDAIISSQPLPEEPMALLQQESIKVDVPGRGKQDSTLAAQMQVLDAKPDNEKRRLLAVSLAGFKSQMECFQESFHLRLALMKERLEKFEVLANHAELGTLSPTMKLAVSKMSNDGLHGKEVEAVMQMYVNGDLTTRNKAIFGLLVGCTESTRRANLDSQCAVQESHRPPSTSFCP